MGHRRSPKAPQPGDMYRETQQLLRDIDLPQSPESFWATQLVV